jgi:LPXTG-motif cell wall-anchored protein
MCAPAQQCGYGSQLDQTSGSLTYGQCVPVGAAALQAGAGAGGGMPGAPGAGGAGETCNDGSMPNAVTGLCANGTQPGAAAPQSLVSAGAEAPAPAPEKKSNAMLWIGLGALALGGYYLYTKSKKKGKRK